MTMNADRRIHVRFFAILREQAGRSSGEYVTSARTPAELYRELQQSLPLEFPMQLLRVSVNARYAEMSGSLRDGDRVVFIPPVAGG